jgi:hypothetical protein
MLSTSLSGGIAPNRVFHLIQGATVTIVNTATGESIRAERTNASGFFTATLLRAGTYNVRVESPNFAVEELRDVTVRVTETTRLTATLKVKTVTESAEVQSEAVTVKTTDATTGESMAGRSIRELPWPRGARCFASRSITERQSLKVSVEFFNLTNTTSFANPTPANNIIDINSVSPTSSMFGPITSIVGTPRLIQFALRYSY